MYSLLFFSLFFLCLAPLVFGQTAVATSIKQIDEGEIVLRLFVALLLGAAVGAERELSNTRKGMVGAAGLRTCSIVCCGSCLIQIISIYAYSEIEGTSLTRDPARLAAQAVSGIGFLGAGAIIRESSSSTVVHGLTTAASLWVCMAVGLGVGAGYYFGSGFGVIAILLALVGFKYLELFLFTSLAEHQLRVHLFEKPHAFRELSKFIESRGAKILSFSLMRKVIQRGRTGIRLNPSNVNLADLLKPEMQRELSVAERIDLISVILTVQCPEFGPNSFTNLCHAMGELDLVYEIVAAHNTTEASGVVPERLRYRSMAEKLAEEERIERESEKFARQEELKENAQAAENARFLTTSGDGASRASTPDPSTTTAPYEELLKRQPAAVQNTAESPPSVVAQPKTSAPSSSPSRFLNFSLLRKPPANPPAQPAAVAPHHDEVVPNPGELADELQFAVERSEIGTVFHGVVNERLQIPVPIVTNVNHANADGLNEIVVKGDENTEKKKNAESEKKKKKDGKN